MLNKALVIGHLGADPRIRMLSSGKKVANFEVASEESWKDKDGNRIAKTEWHRCTMYSALAQVAETYLKKGRLVHIEGKLHTYDYTPADGIKRYVTEIVASNMTMLDKLKTDAIPAPEAIPADDTTFGEDVPF